MTYQYPREDKCNECGKHLGWVMNQLAEALALGICEECRVVVKQLGPTAGKKFLNRSNTDELRAFVEKIAGSWAAEIRTGDEIRGSDAVDWLVEIVQEARKLVQS